jgi:CheY-like chemotaxis protein
VLADRSLLAKVFQNLISNAIKFRSDRPPRIAIDATEQDGAWTFSISDNGIGIAPEHRERLFKLFQRLNPHGSFPGSGIGLATCRRIVERRGGRIWADSTPGAGATFRFTVPRERVATEAIRRHDSTRASILLVDDNAGDIELLKEVFREHADEVEVGGAVGGSALIELLSRSERSRLPSAVLIDLNMPGMDGKAVLSFLKSHPIYRGIPAVMYSSSMRQSERQQCLQLGADDYIVKPASMKDCQGVVNRIRELLRSE